MPMYVLTYNKNEGNFSSEEIREELIKFLYENRATEIKQCLETTFMFKGGRNTSFWKRKITDELRSRNGIFEHCFCLFSRVYYTQLSAYEIFGNCNPTLQDYVEGQIEKLKRS